MMYKRFFLLVIYMNLLPFYLLAQAKWTPGAVAEGGLIIGAYESNFDARASVFMGKNGWSVGLGSGIDYYRFRTVPVFLQGRKWIGQRKNKPFVMASAGLNLLALYPSEKQPNWWISPPVFPAPWPNVMPRNFNGGYYAEAGGGFAFLNKKERGLTLSLSWVRKTLEEWYETDSPAYINPGMKDKSTTQYLLNRTVFRVGWKW